MTIIEQSNKTHYVDNKKLYLEMIKYKEKYNKAKEEGVEPPRMSNYIGLCILTIAKKISNRPNFCNYSFKEDMISDGVEDCIHYGFNFDPDKSKAPFSYFTKIIWWAFLRRIKKEKKILYTKYKSILHTNLEMMLNSGEDELYTEQIKQSEGAYDNMNAYIEEFEKKENIIKQKRKK